MSGPARVLLVLHRAARAGTEFHVLWLAEGLKKRGWSVDLAVSEGGPMIAAFDAAGVAAHRIRRGRGMDPAYVVGIARLARRLGVDVLHAHSGRVPIVAGRLAGVPVCIETRHGLGGREEEPAVGRWRAAARRCRWSHMTLTVSAVDRERLIAGGLDPARVRHIPNGIPPVTCAQSARSPGRVRLGFLGRLTEQKDPLFLIPIAAALDRRAPGRWTLVIAGDGPLRGRLESEFRLAGVRFLGEIERPETLLSQIDVLLAPSVSEGQPIAILQAMACGVPVLGRDIATLRELLGGAPPAGALLPADPSAWAAEIVSLADDASRREALSREAKARIDAGHGLATMVERIEIAYRETLAGTCRG